MCCDNNHRIVVSYNPLKFQAANLKNGDFLWKKRLSGLTTYSIDSEYIVII